MAQDSSVFGFVFSEGEYAVAVRRSARGVTIRDSAGVVRTVRGDQGDYEVDVVGRPSPGNEESQTPEATAAFAALADMAGLHACGEYQVELCAAAIRHLLVAPFSREHWVSVVGPGVLSHNGATKHIPGLRSARILGPSDPSEAPKPFEVSEASGASEASEPLELFCWSAATALGPL
jgi:hypothetical protein